MFYYISFQKLSFSQSKGAAKSFQRPEGCCEQNKVYTLTHVYSCLQMVTSSWLWAFAIHKTTKKDILSTNVPLSQTFVRQKKQQMALVVCLNVYTVSSFDQKKDISLSHFLRFLHFYVQSFVWGERSTLAVTQFPHLSLPPILSWKYDFFRLLRELWYSARRL